MKGILIFPIVLFLSTIGYSQNSINNFTYNNSTNFTSNQNYYSSYLIDGFQFNKKNLSKYFSFGQAGQQENSASSNANDNGENGGDEAKVYKIYLGALYEFRGVTSTNPGEGWQIRPEAAPFNFGATVLVPFGIESKLGLAIDLKFTQRRYGTVFAEDDLILGNQYDSFTERINYFTFSPKINLGGFVLGINYNSPISGRVLDGEGEEMNNIVLRNPSSGGPLPESAKNYDQNLSSFIEFVLGGDINLYSSRTGKLNLIIEGSYALGGTIDDIDNYQLAREFDGNAFLSSSNEDFNPILVSLTLGLNYRFNVNMNEFIEEFF